MKEMALGEMTTMCSVLSHSVLIAAHETAADLKLSYRETRKTKQLLSQYFLDSMSRVPYDPYRTDAMETGQLRKWSWSWWHLAISQACERLGQEDHSHSFWKAVAGGS